MPNNILGIGHFNILYIVDNTKIFFKKKHLIIYAQDVPYLLKKRIKGHTYYYLSETQRIQGKPRITWQKYLGTPERIWKKFEEKEESIQKIKPFELGYVVAIEAIEKELGFQEIVDRIVPKRHQGMSVGWHLYLIGLAGIIWLFVLFIKNWRLSFSSIRESRINIPSGLLVIDFWCRDNAHT
jgi:hypothetical protein